MTTQVWRATINAWSGLVESQKDALARQTVQRMAYLVVQATPVDTGFLRGSWQPALDVPLVRDAASVGVDPSGDLALSSIGLVVAGMKAGPTFYLMNGCAYALFVEEGTSKMMGRHYVGDTVRQWLAVVRAVARDLGFG